MLAALKNHGAISSVLRTPKGTVLEVDPKILL